MNKKRMYFELLDISYCKAQLKVRVANLVSGQPDGYIGTPLVIGNESRVFTIIFDGVSEFRSSAEPCFVAEGNQNDITDFLFECIGSQYSEHVCPFGVGAREPARHFCVFTESVVVEVLSKNEPKIEA
jgi:hypothetical protein